MDFMMRVIINFLLAISVVPHSVHIPFSEILDTPPPYIHKVAVMELQ